MSSHNYTRTLISGNWNTDIGELSREVKNSFPSDNFVLHAQGTSLVFNFENVLSQEQIDTLDSAVSTHQSGSCPLDMAKQRKCYIVDAKTRELIAKGFKFPATSSNWFSLSDNAQKNLVRIHSSVDSITYPITFNTLDDEGSVTVTNSTEFTDFFNEANSTIQTHLSGGTDLKTQVRNATTLGELSEIVDNR